jgi:hypothetical protein
MIPNAKTAIELARVDWFIAVSNLIVQTLEFSIDVASAIGDISIDEANAAIRKYFNENMNKIDPPSLETSSIPEQNL